MTVRSCRPIHAKELTMVGIGSFVSFILLSFMLRWVILASFFDFYSKFRIMLILCDKPGYLGISFLVFTLGKSGHLAVTIVPSSLTILLILLSS